MSIEEMDNIVENLSKYFTEALGTRINKQQIFNALFLLLSDKYELERPSDIWDAEIDFDSAKNSLLLFNFETLNQQIILPKEIVPEEYVMMIKVQIKSNGLIWFIHRYDADPFPSDPHAHQIDNNIKLDLSNGKCYRKREYLFSISKKELKAIRMLANKRFKGKLPPLNLEN